VLKPHASRVVSGSQKWNIVHRQSGGLGWTIRMVRQSVAKKFVTSSIQLRLSKSFHGEGRLHFGHTRHESRLLLSQ
jgi:hypothetical protein